MNWVGLWALSPGRCTASHTEGGRQGLHTWGELHRRKARALQQQRALRHEEWGKPHPIGWKFPFLKTPKKKEVRRGQGLGASAWIWMNPSNARIFFLSIAKSRALSLSLSQLHAGREPLGKLYNPFCTSLSISVKCEQYWTYLSIFFIRIEKTEYVHVKLLTQHVSECSAKVSLYFSIVSIAKCCPRTFRWNEFYKKPDLFCTFLLLNALLITKTSLEKTFLTSSYLHIPRSST